MKYHAKKQIWKPFGEFLQVTNNILLLYTKK